MPMLRSDRTRRIDTLAAGGRSSSSKVWWSRVMRGVGLGGDSPDRDKEKGSGEPEGIAGGGQDVVLGQLRFQGIGITDSRRLHRSQLRLKSCNLRIHKPKTTQLGLGIVEKGVEVVGFIVNSDLGHSILQIKKTPRLVGEGLEFYQP